jgi:hypothetical protein
MKRFFVFFFACFTLLVFAEDVHKIILKDGRIVKSDTKPMISGDRLYFERYGMMLYLPVDKVDVRKTERGGDDITPAAESPKKKTSKKIVVSDDELQQIRKKSRLANEDEIRALEAPPAEGEGSGDQPGIKVSSNTSLQGKLNSLMDQRSQAQSQINDIMGELSSKRDQYGFATMAADKDRLESDIKDTESRLSNARSQLSALDNQVNATQQEIASTPIIVETGGTPSAPPPPPPPSQEGD